MKIAVITLGCKVNQAESAYISGTLKEEGHELVTLDASPDICIINTCTVTAKSDYQARQLIRKSLRTGSKVIATGCYAQLRAEELSKIKGIDFILGNAEKDKLPEYINKLSLDNKSNRQRNTRGHPSVIVTSPQVPLAITPYFLKRSRAFLKIQDGCNFSCSYCTIPRARGKSRSLSSCDILKAVDEFDRAGYKEIILTGIHIGNYGQDLRPRTSLLDIINKISSARPHVRFRLSSIEPQEFTEEFLLLIKAGKLCPHLHIPLQSGCDHILKTMRRGYTVSFYQDLITKIISVCPDIAIGTDIIVGFPGEGDKEFSETVTFLETLPFSYLHIFPYSSRPGTKAADMPRQIDSTVKKQRVKTLSVIAEGKKSAYIARFSDKELNVIVEGKESVHNGLYKAISGNYIKVLIKTGHLDKGQRLRVKAIDYIDQELICLPL